MGAEILVPPTEALVQRFTELEKESTGLAMEMAGMIADIAKFKLSNDTAALVSLLPGVNTFSDRTSDLKTKAKVLQNDLNVQIEEERNKVVSANDEAFRNIEKLKSLRFKIEDILGDNSSEDDNIFDLNETLPNLQGSLVKALLSTNGYEVVSIRRVEKNKNYVLPKNEEEITAFVEYVYDDEYFHSIASPTYSNKRDEKTGQYEVISGIDIDKIGLQCDFELESRRNIVRDEIMAFHVQYSLFQ